MRQNLFLSVLRQDVAFFDSHKSGEIMSRLTSDVQVRAKLLLERSFIEKSDSLGLWRLFSD